MKQNMISAIFGFRSVVAMRITRISILLSSLAALAVIPGFGRMIGCLGFLGLIGVATVAELFSRRTANGT